MGAPGPYSGTYGSPYSGGYPPPVRRRGGLRWAFVGIAVIILALGVVLLLVSADPGAFGLRYSSLFPFGGGLLGVVLLLWGSLMLLRVAARSGRRGYGAGYGGGYGRGGGRRFDPAVMVARQRYARGEITREQFEQIVRDLRGPRGPPP